ncbi:AAA family ATPase [Pseudomonas sp. Pseusp122]|uniref:AAA family ATPase n=1 Tax=unclassified Pseudomonas TaxID=196821 RepID=UPI0039A515AD
MKVLVLTGPESSGKSWLSAEIERQYGALVVREYVREFIELHDRDTCYADIDAIALGQLAREDAARATAARLVVLDTHLLSNMLWSQTLFAACPSWIEGQLLSRRYDLHLLLAPEGVNWISDGQRCQPQLSERQKFFTDSQRWLERHQQAFQIITGNWDTRREQAFAAVEQLLEEDQRI